MMNLKRGVVLAATALALGGVAALTVTGASATTPDVNGANYHAVTPDRLFDTRNPGMGALGPDTSESFSVAGVAGVPADATAVTLNVTVADQTAGGFLTVYPGQAPRPLASNLNWGTGQGATSNLVTVPIGTDGTVDFYNKNGTTDVIADLEGYYTNDPAYTPPPTTYGVGQVWINTKYGTTQWAQYETVEAGAPGGDQASGEFRFTCTLADGCDLSLKAYSTADGYTVYPRIVLEKEDNTTGDKLTCEYADGTNNEGGTAALTGTAATINLGVGSTFDCGSTVQTGTPADGVDHINVPGATGQGIHYDANVTLTFVKAAS